MVVFLFLGGFFVFGSPVAAAFFLVGFFLAPAALPALDPGLAAGAGEGDPLADALLVVLPAAGGGPGAGAPAAGVAEPEDAIE